jgi:hypothetical protein
MLNFISKDPPEMLLGTKTTKQLARITQLEGEVRNMKNRLAQHEKLCKAMDSLNKGLKARNVALEASLASPKQAKYDSSVGTLKASGGREVKAPLAEVLKVVEERVSDEDVCENVDGIIEFVKSLVEKAKALLYDNINFAPMELPVVVEGNGFPFSFEDLASRVKVMGPNIRMEGSGMFANMNRSLMFPSCYAMSVMEIFKDIIFPFVEGLLQKIIDKHAGLDIGSLTQVDREKWAVRLLDISNLVSEVNDLKCSEAASKVHKKVREAINCVVEKAKECVDLKLQFNEARESVCKWQERVEGGGGGDGGNVDRSNKRRRGSPSPSVRNGPALVMGPVYEEDEYVNTLTDVFTQARNQVMQSIPASSRNRLERTGVVDIRISQQIIQSRDRATALGRVQRSRERERSVQRQMEVVDLSVDSD